MDTLWETAAYLRKGGLVMVPLAAVSVWMWLLIVKKIIELRALKREDSAPSDTAVFTLDGSRIPYEWGGELVRKFLEHRVLDAETDKTMITQLVRNESNRLEKHLGTIVALASVAPLLGLLGTVTGMITTFDVISQFGTGNARALAAGISEALITTQSGLIIAIPGLFMGNVLRRRVQRRQDRLERLGLHLRTRCEAYESRANSTRPGGHP